MTAIGLDKLSAGRFILGLGATGPQVVEGSVDHKTAVPLLPKDLARACR
jgi:alkanesulfonate monooxygenase SsuD/methylene tetrahydromethanopterin reductase-like flavin-dependent oxidoreductase (luciferase family)